MTKFKKFLASLISCCLALVLVFAAGCSAPEDSSDSSSASTSSSEEANSSATSSSENSSSSSTTSSSEESSSETSSSEASSSEESSSEESSSEESSSEESSSEADTSDDDDYTLTSTTVYFVGDSTVCEFSDSYYLPRYGYGTQFSNYVDSSVTVKNLALSGRSSKSFISESNYTTLTSSITTGDYLIIGFGHNDEKSDDSTRYTTPEKDAVSTTGSFQYYLYNYYIKVAEDAGATPILCTPIVRYSSDADYTGSKAHITSDGDYAACIRDLAEDYNITCVDLTSITKADYTTLGEDAQWYHAHTGVTLSDDSSAREIGVTGSTTETVKVVATGRDDTHLNMYGAKMVAYEIASALQSARKTCNLGYYVNSSISAPTADDLEAAYNSSYTYTYYNAFDASTDASTNWTLISSGWYGSAMGVLGGNSVSPYTISETTEGVINVGSTNSTKGKISSDGDGFAIAFMQLAYNQNFEMTVTATVTMAAASSTEGTASTEQSGFGIMLRDDMYIDTRNDTLTSNYVTAGMYRASSATNMMHYRESGTLTTTGKSTTSNYSVGDTATLTIVRTGQNITCTVVYNGETYTYTHYDFDLVAVDSTYMYLGLYATRGTVVEYSNINYTATGTAGDA